MSELRDDHDRQISLSQARAESDKAARELRDLIERKSLTPKELSGQEISEFRSDDSYIFITTSYNRFAYIALENHYGDYDLYHTQPSIKFAIKNGIVSGDEIKEYQDTKAAEKTAREGDSKRRDLERIADRYPDLDDPVRAMLDGLGNQ